MSILHEAISVQSYWAHYTSETKLFGDTPNKFYARTFMRCLKGQKICNLIKVCGCLKIH